MSEKLVEAKNDFVYIITELRKENVILNKRISENEEETNRFMSSYQKEMKIKDVKIQDLEKKFLLYKESSEKELQFVIIEFEERILEYSRELANAQKRCQRNEKIQHLTEKEYQELQQLRNFNDQSTIKIRLLENKIENIHQEHKRDGKEITRDNLVSKAKLMKAMEKEVVDIRKRALEEARDDFESGVMHIIENNKKMTFELKDKIHVLEELQRKTNQVELILSKAKQNLKISKETEVEYSKQIYWHCKEQKKFKNEIKMLQQEILRFKQRKEKENIGSTVLSNHENNNNLADDDVTHLKSMLCKKNLELTRIKSMANQVLDQRSETEQFLCDSIAFVKKMMIKEKKGKRLKASSQDDKSYLPFIGDKNEKKIEPKEKIELSELSWQDRERVLRLLLARIN